MKTKNNVMVWLVVFILVSCAPAAKVAPTETAVPISTLTSDNWKEFSSKFTSDVGTIQYSLRSQQEQLSKHRDLPHML